MHKQFSRKERKGTNVRNKTKARAEAEQDEVRVRSKGQYLPRHNNVVFSSDSKQPIYYSYVVLRICFSQIISPGN